MTQTTEKKLFNEFEMIEFFFFNMIDIDLISKWLHLKQNKTEKKMILFYRSLIMGFSFPFKLSCSLHLAFYRYKVINGLAAPTRKTLFLLNFFVDLKTERWHWKTILFYFFQSNCYNNKKEKRRMTSDEWRTNIEPTDWYTYISY